MNTFTTPDILIRGARLLTQDDALGELCGDLLVHEGRIEAVAPQLHAPAAEVVDAHDMLVLPGFVDTHRHTWQTALRHIGVGWNLSDYVYRFFLRQGPAYTPEDVYVGNLLGAVAALESGITTLRDESNIQNTPAHTDAAIQALRDSGIRAVFDHGYPATEAAAWLRDSTRPHPNDIRRVRRELLSSDDALVTLGMMVRGAELCTPEVVRGDIALMRELGLRGCIHVGCGEASRNRGVLQLHRLGLMGSDLCYIHACTCSDDELTMIRDSGGTVSVAATIDANMPGLGWPATRRALRHGIKPSLSVDVEVTAAGDMFSAMRAAYTAQQLEIVRDASEAEAGGCFTPRELLSFATLEGARACGLDHRVGSLTPGKQADLIFVRASDLNLAPAFDSAAALVAAAHPGNVDTVMVAGRFMKRHGKMIDLDAQRLVRLAAQSRDRLMGASAASG